MMDASLKFLLCATALAFWCALLNEGRQASYRQTAHLKDFAEVLRAHGASSSRAGLMRVVRKVPSVPT